jgi:TRAP-type C4-dicarboxylate transport system permease large subunit
VTLKSVVKEALPFLLISIGVLFLVTYAPAISLYLPTLFGFIR